MVKFIKPLKKLVDPVSLSNLRTAIGGGVKVPDDIADVVIPTYNVNSTGSTDFFKKGDTTQKLIASSTNYATGAGGTGRDWYTVTAGKTFYLQTLTFSSDVATAESFRDGTGNPLLIQLRVAALGQIIFQFPVPVAFKTIVRSDTGDAAINAQLYATFVGWEE